MRAPFTACGEMMRRSTVTTAGRRTFDLDAVIDPRPTSKALPPSVTWMLQQTSPAASPEALPGADQHRCLRCRRPACPSAPDPADRDGPAFKRLGDDGGIELFVFGFDADGLLSAPIASAERSCCCTSLGPSETTVTEPLASGGRRCLRSAAARPSTAYSSNWLSCQLAALRSRALP